MGTPAHLDKFSATQFRIARPTGNLQKVMEFYVNVLGLPLLSSFDNHDGYSGIMIGMPGYQHHLEFTQHEQHTPGPPPSKDNLLVFYFETREELLVVKNRIQDSGALEVEPENPYWKGRGFTFEDPDGWRIVLHDGLFLHQD